jgi:formylglycine-generating enzyme required for sulfatase activity
MPHIFLSYSRNDAALMERVRADFRANGLDVWTDEGIKPGTPSWKRAIEDAIRSAGCLVCILSPDAAQSRWVREELDFAEGRDKRIFLLMAHGDEDEAVPFGFSTHQWVDIRHDYGLLNSRLIPVICEYLGVDCTSQLPKRSAHEVEDEHKLEVVERVHIRDETPGVEEERYLSAQPGGDRGVLPRAIPGKIVRRFPLNQTTVVRVSAVVVFILAAYLIATIAVPKLSLRGLSGSPVTSNSEWTPTSQTFNGVEMVLVPAGCFMMGSEDGADNERPVHQQCFNAPFWIDRYEVTNAQFGSTGCEGVSSQPEQPRSCADWFEARDHCGQRGARLPNEAEWEYAARGPDSLVYPWGNEFAADNVVYVENSGDDAADVGSRPGGVSWVGAYHMSGNVWEWVSTIYDEGDYPYPYHWDDGREDLEQTDALRGLRGGSFLNFGDSLRAAYRRGRDSDREDGINGFRCALSQ